MIKTHNIENTLNCVNNQEFEQLQCTDLVSQDDIKSIKLVNSSIENANGHYIMRLSWKVKPEILTDNKSLSLRSTEIFEK